MAHKTLSVVVLKYEEPGWTKATLDCVAAVPYPLDVVIADRGGIWGMADAYNAAMAEVRSDFVWFVSNVRFDPGMGLSLLDVMEQHPEAAAVHPRHRSDHLFLTGQGGEVEAVPFIEWTAPLVRRSAWSAVGPLDEDMPFVHYDLDWSYRAKQAGYSLWVDNRFELEHVYLHSTKSRYAVTEERRKMRDAMMAGSEAKCAQKYGPEWKSLIWPGAV